MTTQLYLFGDSVIDNGTYVQEGEPDVCAQIAAALPEMSVRMCALDGGVVSNVSDALAASDLPDDVAVMISAGGNDALLSIGLLGDPSEMTFASAMNVLRELREGFRARYIAMLEQIPTRDVLLCTVCNPKFEGGETDLQAPAEGALSAFNDVIQQEGLSRGHSILDLRRLFVAPEDYANPIEPSVVGGQKIADAVVEWIGGQR